MKYLVPAALVVVCALVLLWRDVNAPQADRPSSSRETSAAARASFERGDAPSLSPAQAASAPASASSASQPGEVAPPPGGVRAWSPTAAPTDGPDPFAPVPEVRTADDTRAGLGDR